MITFFLVQFLSIILVASPFVYYAITGKKTPTARFFRHVAGQLYSNRHWRSKALILIATVLTIEMFIVYSNSGFPESPLAKDIRGINDFLKEIGMSPAQLANNFLVVEYFDENKPIEEIKSSSWSWFFAFLVIWPIVTLNMVNITINGFLSQIKQRMASSDATSITRPNDP